MWFDHLQDMQHRRVQDSETETDGSADAKNSASYLKAV